MNRKESEYIQNGRNAINAKEMHRTGKDTENTYMWE
jgi:hypothetical protein